MIPGNPLQEGEKRMTTRDQVLRMLEEEGTVSGEKLGETIRVSRNAVWKAVSQLRQEGYGIEAGPNRGYRLVSVPDRLAETEIRKWLTTKEFGREMEVYPLLDSTNLRAKTLAGDGAPQGFLVAADSQSAGRGRLGRSFYSPEHSGVYLSVILRPKCSPERASLITSLAAVAAARAAEKVSGAEIHIKWVNDLYIGKRKICGILSEAGFGMETGQLEYVVVGIGMNVRKMEFPPELKDIAGSIGNETGKEPDRNRLTAEIINELEAAYGQLETGEFLEESRRRSNVIGREIRVIEGGREYPARAVAIDDEGKLVIRTEAGESRLGFGEVSLRF